MYKQTIKKLLTVKRLKKKVIKEHIFIFSLHIQSRGLGDIVHVLNTKARHKHQN